MRWISRVKLKTINNNNILSGKDWRPIQVNEGWEKIIQ